jgi:V8-like Glu-specific endopeptidase
MDLAYYYGMSEGIIRKPYIYLITVIVGIICLVHISVNAENISSNTSRIFGGEPTDVGELPNVVAITLEDGTVFCSGVLIGLNTVLTAAHCIDAIGIVSQFKENARIYVGDGAPTALNPQYRAKLVYIHPSYNRTSEFNRYDLAVIVLDREALSSLSDVIDPLFNEAEANNIYHEGQEILLAGFGRTNEGTMGVKYKVMTDIKTVYEQEFFAGGNGKDTCNGDSGGPVFAKNIKGEWRLVGITSRGSSVCSLGGLYGRVDQLMLWSEFKLLWDMMRDGAPSDEESIKYGSAAMDRGDYNTAIMLYTRAFDSGEPTLKHYTLLAAAYAGRGYEKAHKGDLKGAKLDYGKAFRYRGKAWSIRGVEYSNRSIEDYSKAIKIDPTDASLYEERATVYELSGDMVKAAADRSHINAMMGAK